MDDLLKWLLVGAAAVLSVVLVIVLLPNASEPNNTPPVIATTTSGNASTTSSTSTTSSSTTSTPDDGVTTSDGVALMINNEPVFLSTFDAAYEGLIENYTRFYQQFSQDFTQQLIGPEGAYYELELRAQLVDQFVREILVEQEIERREIQVPADLLEVFYQQRLNGILVENGLSEEELDGVLQQQGSSLEQFKGELRNQISSEIKETQLIEAISGTIEVSDASLLAYAEQEKFLYFETLAPIEEPSEEELLAYYNEHGEDFKQVRASHILIRVEDDATEAEIQEAKERAETLKQRADSGDDFAGLAKEFSQDTGTGAIGGDLGFFNPGQMVRPFEQVAFSLPMGQVSEPVRTQFGFHLILVQETRVRPYEEVEGDVHFQVFQTNQDRAFSTFMTDVRLGDPESLAILKAAVEEDYITYERTELFEIWLKVMLDSADIEVHMPLVNAIRLSFSDTQEAIELLEDMIAEGGISDPNFGFYLCQVYQRRYDEAFARIESLEADVSLSQNEQEELDNLKSFINLYEIQAGTC